MWGLITSLSRAEMSFGDLFLIKCRRRYIRNHNSIQNDIASIFEWYGWNVSLEFWEQDMDSTYRYDIVAEKNGEFNAVEVKTEITTKDFGQLWSYILQFKKLHPGSKYYLGTDCLNYWVLKTGEIGEMLARLMMDEGLEVILVNPKRYWIFNDHESFITAEDEGPLCCICEYCDEMMIPPSMIAILKNYIPELARDDLKFGAIVEPSEIEEIRRALLKVKEEIRVKHGIRIR